MTQEELLAEAIRRYPNGTNYRCAWSSQKYIVDTLDIRTYRFVTREQIDGGFNKGYLYYEGKWAEVISYSEDNINIFIV